MALIRERHQVGKPDSHVQRKRPLTKGLGSAQTSACLCSGLSGVCFSSHPCKVKTAVTGAFDMCVCTRTSILCVDH